MKKIIFLFLLIGGNQLLGQNANSIWVFGDSAGIDFSNINNPIPINSGMDERGSCASISDTSGNLLFYCFSTLSGIDSAVLVYDYSHDTMSNGGYLIGPSYYSNLIILPMPGDSSKYYIFHSGFYNTTIGLFYSIVDMGLNGGQGGVIQKNILLNNARQGDCLQAVKHGNGSDWWILSKLGGSGTTQIDRFFVYRIFSGNNIMGPTIYDFGIGADVDLQKLIFNNNKNKIMNINVGGLMVEYDFNRCTGNISNPNIIFPQQFSNFNRIFFEGAYSPNDSIFYISRNSYGGSFGNRNYLLQYNLTAVNVPASCDTLDSNYTYPPVDNGALRLAPDSKIYYSQAYISSTAISVPYADSMRNYVNENLGVINNPNLYGTACNFVPFSFYLGGKRTYYGLPNNPNYTLGRWLGSPCDTLGVGIEETEMHYDAAMFVFYHSSWQKAFINAQHLKGKKFTLRVYDALGKEVHKEIGKLRTEYFTKDVDCTALAKGVYVVSFTTEKEKLVKRFVKE